MRLFLILMLVSVRAFCGIADGVLCTRESPCATRGLYTNRSAGPTKSDSLKINPAAVPVEKITGLETIYYKGGFDFALVKGLGRVGAAISPSNSDETFFGPPSAEDPTQFLQRMVNKDKFNGGKYALATAFNLFDREGSGFDHLNLSVGASARYEVATQHIRPGAGLQLIAGPFYVGGGYYQDEEQIDPEWGAATETLNTHVTSWSAGLSLDSILLDYSVLQVEGDDVAKASVATLTGFVSLFMLTASWREVISQKPAYNYAQSFLYQAERKDDYFFGAQVKATSFLVLGVFYNYYLLHEASLGATVFF